ncbi:MAG TPA: hypothetical protein VLJ37_06275 [bacterium]|nr:hypothetical protein [bacterium]
MIFTAVISLSEAFSPAQRGLLTYMGTWSQLSLSQARLDPFSTRNLSQVIQDGIASGEVVPEGLEPFSASSYVRRAETYESALLVSLGVDADAIDSFVRLGVSYGDYFSEPLHPWQEDQKFAVPLIRQMTELHGAIALARERIDAWKRSHDHFKLIREEFGMDRILGQPLHVLHGILERNVGRARWVIQRRGMTEEGLLEYFRIPNAGWSGLAPREEAIDFDALQTVIPPPAL